MKIRRGFLMIALCVVIPFMSYGQENVALQELSTEESLDRIETPFDYNKGIIRSKLDYRLSSNDKGKFVLKFINKPNTPLSVKIYDVIGNLIHNDEINNIGTDQREYDFTERKTRIFVVKVEAGRDNVIKKVNT